MTIRTGIIRRVDELGRVVIPVELRNQLGIGPGQPVEILQGEQGDVILRPYQRRCALCGKAHPADLRAFREGFICTRCLREVRELLGL